MYEQTVAANTTDKRVWHPCSHCYCQEVSLESGLHKFCCNCGNKQLKPVLAGQSVPLYRGIFGAVNYPVCRSCAHPEWPRYIPPGKADMVSFCRCECHDRMRVEVGPDGRFRAAEEHS